MCSPPYSALHRPDLDANQTPPDPLPPHRDHKVLTPRAPPRHPVHPHFPVLTPFPTPLPFPPIPIAAPSRPHRIHHPPIPPPRIPLPRLQNLYIPCLHLNTLRKPLCIRDLVTRVIEHHGLEGGIGFRDVHQPFVAITAAGAVARVAVFDERVQTLWQRITRDTRVGGRGFTLGGGGGGAGFVGAGGGEGGFVGGG